MKSIALVAVVGAFLLLPADRTGLSAQSAQCTTEQDLNGSGTSHFAPESTHNVTITRKGALVTRLEIPKGFFLSVHGDGRPIVSRDLGGVEFHGHVTIRIRPANEVDRSESHSAADIMALAPVIMTAEDSDVLVRSKQISN
jgi:hypothetical protein